MSADSSYLELQVLLKSMPAKLLALVEAVADEPQLSTYERLEHLFQVADIHFYLAQVLYYLIRKLGQPLDHEQVLRFTAQHRILNLAQAQTMSLLDHVELYALYDRFGRHCYCPTDNLALQLSATELRGLKGSDFQLPHPVVCIEVPAGLNFQFKTTEQTPLRFIYLAPFLDTVADFWMRIYLVGDKTTPDAINRRILQWQVIADRPLNCDMLADNEQPIFRWLVNVIFYATSPTAEREDVFIDPVTAALWNRIQKLPKVSAKRDRLKADFKRANQTKRTVLGRSVKLDRSSAEYYRRRLAEPTGAPLTVRVLVSGHWRRYHVGAGRTELAAKWIAPYWRGPEDALTANSTVHRLGKE